MKISYKAAISSQRLDSFFGKRKASSEVKEEEE